MPSAAHANVLMCCTHGMHYVPRTTRIAMILCVSVPNLHDCLLDREEYHGQRAFDENVHMNRHRVIARGNATFFSLL